ncbi:protein-lysine N-methyltransferase EEF2KMT [Hyperolius riggenbachi]|uniref:protein-lysine N-methyltransferase EEF2KMT n=1 Tax=Hyperolius riggenbachi TaxID=752182 RepID=UPI0035A2D2D0
MDITENSLCATFQQSFLCCRRVGSLPWQELENLLTQQPCLVLNILEKTVNHPLTRKYPPSLQYRRLFLLELIKKHEKSGAEPLDDLYSALAEVLNSEENTVCYKSYFLPSGDAVTLCENIAIISEGTTGLVTWEAALYLAEWAIGNIDVFRNRTILELGSGIGLTGLAICKSCFPKKYIFSDCHQMVLQHLRDNICLNGFVLGKELESQEDTENTQHSDIAQLSVMELDWDSITEQQLSRLEADVIIASDVVYDPDIVTSFTKVLCKLLLCRKVNRHPELLIASTIRNSETYKLFQTKLDDAGLKWQILDDPKRSIFSYQSDCLIQILNVTLKV